MAITEDASTPAIATGAGVGTLATSAFSPPSGTLVIALVAAGYQGTSAPSVTVADSSGGGNWASPVSQANTSGSFLGDVAIFTKYFAAGPGSITVTATYTNLGGGRFMAVRVLNGAAASQVGAAIAAREINPGATAYTTAITTTVAGSLVYGVCDDPITNGTLTAAASTTLVGVPFQNASDAVSSAACVSTAATGSPGAITLGCTNSAADAGVLALLEILPAVVGGTSIDGDPFLGADPGIGLGPGPFGVFGWGVQSEQTVVIPPTPVLYDWNSEGGTNGTTIATSDTGSGIQWGAVTVGTGATVQYTSSALEGGLSALYSVASTPALAYTQWNTPAAFGQWHYAGFWFRYPSTLGGPAAIFSLGVGASPAASLRINAANKLEITEADGDIQWTSGVTLTPGSPYFVAMAFQSAAAGQFQVFVYDQTCAIVDSTHLLAAGLLASADNVKYGCVTTQTDSVWLPLILDQVSYGNTRLPTPVPLQLTGPFTTRTSYVRSLQRLRGAVPAGGGTPWMVSPVDDSGLSDTDGVTIGPAPADSAGLTDVPGVMPVHGVSQADSTGLTDAEATTGAPAPSDSAGLSDTQVADRSAFYADSAGLTELAIVSRLSDITRADDSGLTDTTAALTQTAPTDDTGLADTAAALSAKLLLPVDDTGLADTAGLNPVHGLAPSDDSGLTDAEGSGRAPVASDDTGLTDVALVVPQHVVTQPDDSGLTDVPGVMPVHGVTTPDDLGLTDVTAFTVSPALTDSAGLTDAEGTARSLALTDSSGLTDTSGTAAFVAVTSADDSGLADTAAATQGPARTDDSGLTDATSFTVGPSPADAAGLTDTAATVPLHAVIQPDDAGLTDTRAVQVAPAATDSTGLTDSDAVLVSQAPVDSSGLSDSPTETRAAAPSDSAGLTDTSVIFSAKLLLPVDDQGLTDSSALARTLAPADDTGLTDVTVTDRAAPVTDSAGLTDVPAVVPAHVVTQADSAGLTDTSAAGRLPAPADDAGLTDTPVAARTAAPTDSAGLTDVPETTRAAVLADSAGLSDTEVTTRAQAVVDDAGITDFISSLRSLACLDDAGLADVPSVTSLEFGSPGSADSRDSGLPAGTIQSGLLTATLTSKDRGAAGS